MVRLIATFGPFQCIEKLFHKLITLLGHVEHSYELINCFMGCLYYCIPCNFQLLFAFFAVAKIQEEKLVEEKEREQLLINFEKHRQLEQKQKEENLLVRPSYIL